MTEEHWHKVESSMDIVGFGIQKGKLAVAFDNKGKRSLYVYTTMEKNLCCRWAQATSIGQFFHSRIKILPYAKIS